MALLAIDVGSSSVKLGLLHNGAVRGAIVRQAFATHYDGERAEVNPLAILEAIARAIHVAGKAVRSVDAIAIAAMAPSWLAMDRRGKPLTPIVTHQDRRSVQIAEALEKRVGKARHLKLAGNRPVPGGISSTTCAWFLQHHRALMRRADLVGHLQTYLLRYLCGARLADPSNASFMGLYATTTQSGWSDELCAAIGISRALLPEVRPGNERAGTLLAAPARRLGLSGGTPVYVGLMDTSAAMLLAEPSRGQLVNVIGSTDVLALCTDQPRPQEKLLTRALGVGKWWLSVATLAAAGSALKWTSDQLCRDLSPKQFEALIASASEVENSDDPLRFEPYLAGERTSVEQKRAALSGLTLATTRDEIVRAIVRSLATAGAERIELLRTVNRRINSRVMVSGGGEKSARMFHRAWKGKWHFHLEEEATLRGLARLLS